MTLVAGISVMESGIVPGILQGRRIRKSIMRLKNVIVGERYDEFTLYFPICASAISRTVGFSLFPIMKYER